MERGGAGPRKLVAREGQSLPLPARPRFFVNLLSRQDSACGDLSPVRELCLWLCCPVLRAPGWGTGEEEGVGKTSGGQKEGEHSQQEAGIREGDLRGMGVGMRKKELA